MFATVSYLDQTKLFLFNINSSKYSITKKKIIRLFSSHKMENDTSYITTNVRFLALLSKLYKSRGKKSPSSDGSIFFIVF